MSVLARGLNTYLRLTEKRALAQATDIDALRRSFALRARLFFHGPFGTRYHWDTSGQVAVQWAAAHGIDRATGPLILYFHGGGYVFGSTNTHRAMMAALSKRSGLPVCLVEYRLAPEHPFPAALEDALAAYAAVSDRPVILGGDSAGGGLALALLGEILRKALPKPVGTFAFSPLTDMTFSGSSIIENEMRDVLLPAARIAEISDAYLVQTAPEDPRASPLFADFRGASPLWLTVGSTEILRDDTIRLADCLRVQDVDVVAKVESDLPHVWPIFHNILPQARATLRDLSGWIRGQMDRA
ncbi:MAG: alpha/beta hydrolase [Pseudomonadota bacterium]